MDIIPTQAVPNQTLTVQLGNQVSQIVLRTTDHLGLYCDLSVNSDPIFQGVICQNKNPLKRAAYLPFVGNLMFIDMQGDSDPVYSGLGSRFQLAYLSDAEAVIILGALG